MKRTREDRFMLWIDAVGGFWVCTADQVTIGQPTRGDAVDIPILGDLSSKHARIVRHGESYLIEPIRETSLRDRQLEKPEPLFDGAIIRLGDHLELLFRRPHPLSMTARLDITSRHQTQPSSDAILLMADTCLLGPDANCHVGCPNWDKQVVLFRRENAMFCKAPGKLELDGKSASSPARIEIGAQASGPSFSFFLEQL
ncbi:MAG: FHA domain-containing protein [Planctomycetia bacterium]|jgi:hypothetical protein